MIDMRVLKMVMNPMVFARSSRMGVSIGDLDGNIEDSGKLVEDCLGGF